jgi:hypothetical protein
MLVLVSDGVSVSWIVEVSFESDILWILYCYLEPAYCSVAYPSSVFISLLSSTMNNRVNSMYCSIDVANCYVFDCSFK